MALGRRAVAASDVTLLMQDAAALVAEMLDADYSSVAELAPGGGVFHVRLCSAKSSAPLEFDVPAGETKSLAGYALAGGHPVAVADLAADTAVVDDRLVRHGIRAAIVCPLKLNDRAFGALGVYRASPTPFAAADVLFVETISHLITTTIARERTERELAAQRLVRRHAAKRSKLGAGAHAGGPAHAA